VAIIFLEPWKRSFPKTLFDDPVVNSITVFDTQRDKVHEFDTHGGFFSAPLETGKYELHSIDVQSHDSFNNRERNYTLKVGMPFEVGPNDLGKSVIKANIDPNALKR